MGFSACNKEQAAVKKLAGEWTVDQLDVFENGTMTYSGPNEEALNFTFEECKLKEDEWCELQLVYPDENYSETSFYQITDDGEKMLIDSDNNTVTTDDRVEVTIVELEKEHLVFHFTETDDDGSIKYQFHLSPK